MKEINWESYWRAKEIDPAHLADKVAALRQQGKTIATLNGSFDLMHAGHLAIIFEASKVADILIVALNTDKSIQQYKSPSRPIIPLSYRLQMMAALGFVSYVTWFDETDPKQILSLIQPDVHVNGVEYGENCIEAEVVKRHGGRIHLVDRIPSLSTTEIINKIKSL
jgi:D-glycero-beta-D-manno-heptose 1-phosphate adenylyltransferase